MKRLQKETWERWRGIRLSLRQDDLQNRHITCYCRSVRTCMRAERHQGTTKSNCSFHVKARCTSNLICNTCDSVIDTSVCVHFLRRGPVACTLVATLGLPSWEPNIQSLAQDATDPCAPRAGCPCYAKFCPENVLLGNTKGGFVDIY